MKRRTPRPQSAEPYVDPAEDAASQAGLALAPSVAALAAIERARHMAGRMAEDEETTRQKVAKWRAGKCQPIGGRHLPERRTT